MDKIGRLDKRVSIQRRSSTKDDYGQEIDSWTTIAQVWAQVHDQVREQVWAQVRAQVREQVWGQVGAQVRDQACEALP